MVARTPGWFASRFPLIRVAAAASLALAPACGGGDEPARTSTPDEGTPQAAAEAPSGAGRRARGAAPAEVTGEEPYASSSLGAVHGSISFVGKVPERFALGASSNADCEHHPEVDQRANVVVVNDGKLAGAFVTLELGEAPSTVPPPERTPARLEQKGCMYVPRVLALRVGQPLLVTNDDPTNHNVHTRSKRNPGINRNMGAKQPPLEFVFEKPERPVPFACDIHPWMGAAVFVEEHPWFAVSDERGAFEIRDVPPGEHTLELVHESLGKKAVSVRVVAGKSTGVALALGK
jgi:plastocyanin